MKQRHLFLIVMLFASFSATVASAQSERFEGVIELSGYVVSNGGESSGGVYRVTDAPGELVSGEASGGNYNLASGFLSGAPTVDNLVLLYFSGDNNLEDDVLDAARQAQAGAHITRTVTVVLMLLDGPGPDDSYLYRLDQRGLTTCDFYTDYTCGGRYQLNYNVWKFADNLGRPETLTDFIVTSVQKYPVAKRVIVSLLGHGGGWSPNLLAGQPKGHVGQPGIGGLIWDDNGGGAQQRGASISTIELSEALSVAQEATQRKIDLLYLDACLMGMWEVALELHPYVHYFLASESWTWTAFAYDQLLEEMNRPQITAAVGQAWVTHKANTIDAWGYPITYSMLDLQQMATISATVTGLATALIEQLPTNKPKITAAFLQTDCFDSDEDLQLDRGSSTEDGDTYCDLLSFATEVSRTFSTTIPVVNAVKAVEGSLQAAVLANRHQNGRLPEYYAANQWAWKRLGGLSIYLPLNEKDDWKRRYYSQLRASSGPRGWDEFINAYRNSAEMPAAPACPDPCRLPAGHLLMQSQNVYLPQIRR